TARGPRPPARRELHRGRRARLRGDVPLRPALRGPVPPPVRRDEQPFRGRARARRRARALPDVRPHRQLAVARLHRGNRHGPQGPRRVGRQEDRGLHAVRGPRRLGARARPARAPPAPPARARGTDRPARVPRARGARQRAHRRRGPGHAATPGRRRGRGAERRRDTMKAVVAGMIGTYPVGGVAWDYGQYAVGLERLGFEVTYLEDTGSETYDPRRGHYGRDPSYSLEFLARTLSELSPTLGRNWHYRAFDGSMHGLPVTAIEKLIQESDLFLNVSGGTLVREPYMEFRNKVLIDT